ncbi:MAG: hypothetical protein GY930_14905 [bacterium]|nr:hypothetical protein [bacterium]
MRDLIALGMVLALAALVPLAFPEEIGPQPTPEGFPGWPVQLDGALLTEVPLGPREERFYALFPTHVKRFTDGESEYLLRWIAAPSRHMHPASACFQGTGWTWEELPPLTDMDGSAWGQARATRDGRTVIVSEQVRGPAGKTWSDVPVWFWEASLGRAHGPWWSVLKVAEE